MTEAWKNGRILWWDKRACGCDDCWNKPACRLNEALTRLTEWGETLNPTNTPDLITRIETLEGSMTVAGEALARDAQLLTFSTGASKVLRNYNLAPANLGEIVFRTPEGEFALYEGQGPICQGRYRDGWRKIQTGTALEVATAYAELSLSDKSDKITV